MSGECEKILLAWMPSTEGKLKNKYSEEEIAFYRSFTLLEWESFGAPHVESQCKKQSPQCRDYCATCEVLDLMKDEIALLREEIWEASKSKLLAEFGLIDINKALEYFKVLPTSYRNARTSFEILVECCEAAKAYKVKEL